MRAGQAVQGAWAGDGASCPSMAHGQAAVAHSPVLCVALPLWQAWRAGGNFWQARLGGKEHLPAPGPESVAPGGLYLHLWGCQGATGTGGTPWHSQRPHTGTISGSRVSRGPGQGCGAVRGKTDMRCLRAARCPWGDLLVTSRGRDTEASGPGCRRMSCGV